MPFVARPGKPTLHYTVDDYTDPWKHAPFVFLQHGNGRSSRFWYSWVPYLSRHYRVVRPDARGLGASSADFDLERDLTVESLVEDLIAVLDALNAESVHFCGESMGGILGLALAALHPERVRTLTLVSTPVYISERMKESYSNRVSRDLCVRKNRLAISASLGFESPQNIEVFLGCGDEFSIAEPRPTALKSSFDLMRWKILS